MSDNLTFAKLVGIMNAIRPPLYYATVEDVEAGQVIWVKETIHHPEYVVINPNDLEFLNNNIIGRRLVHLRDTGPTSNTEAKRSNKNVL
jgi:hypothetical protein